MSEHVTDLLSEYLDEELSVSQAESVRAHLAGCAECSRTLEELRVVVVMASRLEPDAVSAEQWRGIAARIEPRRRPIPSLIGRLSRIPRRFEVTVPQLAAAGLALVLLSGGAVWFALRGGAPRDGAVPRDGLARSESPFATPTPDEGSRNSPTAPAPRSAPRSSSPSGAEASFAAFDGTSYDAAVAELERALREHGSELDTTTVRILQQNLAIIDRAIEQARAALLADPANSYLNGHLAQQLRMKVKLLQRATGVVTSQG